MTNYDRWKLATPDYLEDTDEGECEEAETRDVVFYKSYDLEVIGWDELINNFNESAVAGEDIKHVCLGLFTSHSAHKIKKVSQLMDELDCTTAHLYFNISLNGGSYGNHRDYADVYFWQCQGKTKWLFNNSEYVLEPGDMIYVKKGVYHHVIPLTPRAGISMGND
jgi:ribosomal protein L16 Arg81 hydroxylase